MAMTLFLVRESTDSAGERTGDRECALENFVWATDPREAARLAVRYWDDQDPEFGASLAEWEITEISTVVPDRPGVVDNPEEYVGAFRACEL